MEKIEAGPALYFSQGHGESVERFVAWPLVRNDHRVDTYQFSANNERNYFAAADGFDLRGIENGAGDDIDGARVDCELAHLVLELKPVGRAFLGKIQILVEMFGTRMRSTSRL